MEEEDRKEKGSWFCSAPEDFSLAKPTPRERGKQNSKADLGAAGGV